MNRISKIQKDSPALADREEIKAVAADVDTYAALDAFSSSEGGKILRDTLITDLASTIDKIASSWQAIDNLALMGLCAQLSDRISFLQSMNRARTNLDLAEEALKELTS